LRDIGGIIVVDFIDMTDDCEYDFGYYDNWCLATVQSKLLFELFVSLCSPLLKIHPLQFQMCVVLGWMNYCHLY
jgi:hypothetical protein